MPSTSYTPSTEPVSPTQFTAEPLQNIPVVGQKRSIRENAKIKNKKVKFNEENNKTLTIPANTDIYHYENIPAELFEEFYQ